VCDSAWSGRAAHNHLLEVVCWWWGGAPWGHAEGHVVIELRAAPEEAIGICCATVLQVLGVVLRLHMECAALRLHMQASHSK
jgi:hypothetical protein